MSEGKYGEPWESDMIEDHNDGKVLACATESEESEVVAWFVDESYQHRAVACVNELVGIDFPPGAVRRVIGAARKAIPQIDRAWKCNTLEGASANYGAAQIWLREALSALNLPDGWKP